MVANDQNALVSPGWKYLAYLTRNDAGNRLIHIRDLATGKELTQIDAGHSATTQTLCFSADDKTLFWDHYPARGIVALGRDHGQGAAPPGIPPPPGWGRPL